MQAVIDNPHITDCSKLSDWVKHWLYDSLGTGTVLSIKHMVAHMHMAVQN